MRRDCYRGLCRVLLVVSALVAWPHTSGAISATSPLTMPPAAFHGWDDSNDHLIRSVTQGSLTGDAPDTPFSDPIAFAPVHLPDGARVTGLVAFALDQNPDVECRVSLFRRRIATGRLSRERLGRAASAGSAPGIQAFSTTAIDSPLIDNSAFVYYLEALVWSDISLYGVQIEFSLPIFNDGFESGDTSAWSATVP